MSRTRRLLVVLALNLALVGALVAVGVTAHSLAVLAEGGDYLLDAAGVGVALLAIRLSARPAGSARRDGAPKAPNVAALINGGWLLVLEVLVAAAAVDRLITGIPQVDGLPVLIVSGIAALVMAGGALILRGDVMTMRTRPTNRTYLLLRPARHHRGRCRSSRRGRDGRDNPGNRRLVLAGPCGSAHHRSRRRLPRHRPDPQGPHPAPTCVADSSGTVLSPQPESSCRVRRADIFRPDGSTACGIPRPMDRLTHGTGSPCIPDSSFS